MRSKIVIMENHESGIEVKGVSSLLDVYDRTNAGDLVIVYPGTYDVGNNSIQLKDGVNWNFMPGVTVSSDSTGGTFKDNNVQCNLRFDGFPTITNSNGLDKRIVLQHASSKLDGFYWEFMARLSQSGTSAPTAEIMKNTLGGVPTYERIGQGYYKIHLVKGFPQNKRVMTLLNPIIFTEDAEKTTCVFDRGGQSDDWILLVSTIRYLESGSEVISVEDGVLSLHNGLINIKVYP